MNFAAVVPSKMYRFFNYALSSESCDLLYHDLSGLFIVADKPVKMLLQLLAKKQSKNLNLLQDLSNQRIKELLDKKFIVPQNTQDEFELFLDYYPIRRRTVLYIEHANDIEVIWGKPAESFTDPKKIYTSQLTSIDAEIFKGAERGCSLRTIVNLIAKKYNLSKEKAYKKVRQSWIKKLAHPCSQLLKLSPHPLRYWKSESDLPDYFFEFVGARRHSNKVKREKKRAFVDEQVVDLKNFHLSGINNALAEFDDVETTVSHVFRFPTPALGGRTYGGAFYDCCRYLKENTKILEVGGGTGFFANCFIKRAYEQEGELAKSFKYQILDLSPVLQKSQKKINHQFIHQMEFTHANAESMDIPKNSVDLLISNEVIADFRTCRLNLNKPTNSAVEKQALKLIAKYNIDIKDAPETFYINLGAILFLEKIKHVLNQKGIAILTEFGGVADYPEPTLHLNHDEYSIHWGHMVQVAKRLGFKKVKLLDLQSFIQFNPYEQVFAGDLEILRTALKRFGTNVEKAVYTKEELKKIVPKKLKGLSFSPLHKGRDWSPTIKDFKVLILRQ